MIHTLAEVPGSRALLQHNGTQEDASELYEGGSLADVVAAASAAAPQQVMIPVVATFLYHLSCLISSRQPHPCLEECLQV